MPDPDPSSMWHLATCNRCNGGTDLGEPFRTVADRDEWVIDHIDNTGHVVVITSDVNRAGKKSHAVLQRIDHMWRYSCLADGCTDVERRGALRWRDGFPTGQLALAAYRKHGCQPEHLDPIGERHAEGTEHTAPAEGPEDRPADR